MPDNPVINLLEEYEEMSENDILSHIRDWWFDVDGKKIFDDAKNSGLIKGKGNNYVLWTLSSKENCSKCGKKKEQVNIAGQHATPSIYKKKKKKEEIILIPNGTSFTPRSFEFVEESNEHWREVEHWLYEDALGTNQKSDTVGRPEFKAFTHSSSFVGNVKWDRESSEMDIILNGNTYHFCRVSERLFDSFEGANSKGAFFNREIKTLHDC
jgi:hypothetical protein